MKNHLIMREQYVMKKVIEFNEEKIVISTVLLGFILFTAWLSILKHYTNELASPLWLFSIPGFLIVSFYITKITERIINFRYYSWLKKDRKKKERDEYVQTANNFVKECRGQ